MAARIGVAQDDFISDYTRPARPKKEKKKRQTTAEVRVVGSVDYGLLLVVSVLVLFGAVMVFSASYMMAGVRFGDPFRFFRLTVIFAAVGFAAMLFLANFSYEFIKKLTMPLYLFSIALLILVIFIGEEGGGATRWLYIPVIGNFQPSELARASIIFTMAYLIDKYPKLPRSFIGIGVLLLVLGVVPLLIALPGGFTVALITGAIGFAIIAVAGPFFWRFLVAGAIAAAGVGAFLYWEYVTDGGFRGGRFGVWLDPFSDRQGRGYQIIQSLFAIASGGWFGLGVGQSQQASFVPEPHNDIIFAIAIEEFGFFGAVVILLMFAVFIWRGIVIAMRAPDTFSSLVALGIVFAIGFQAIINIAVVTNTIPNTGVNLPFISYGGTSLLISMALAGILLNISRYSVQSD